MILALALAWFALLVFGWLGWQLLRQNGRILLRLDELEKRLNEWEFGSGDGEVASGANEVDRASRFNNHSLKRSRLPRNGLKQGTIAPEFRLPRLDGGELALEELRGRRVLLIFSDPQCGPCSALAPELQEFHVKYPELAMVMISRGEPKDNRAKAKEHSLTFPIVLQQQWEISRKYAMFATPIAYLIDEAGVIDSSVAVGVEDIQKLITRLTA